MLGLYEKYVTESWIDGFDLIAMIGKPLLSLK